MSDEATPLVRPSHGGLRDWLLRWCVSAAVRASLLVSPRPAALLVRKVFASSGVQLKKSLDQHAPADVVALVDERYGEESDVLLDVFRPASASGPLPLLLWVHGGGFCGGAKDELAGYFKLVASNGYVVAAPRYSLAPEHHYPAPPRQMMQALDYLQANAERLQIDPGRIALAGDSAGAHIAAPARCAHNDPRLHRDGRRRSDGHAGAAAWPRSRLRPLRSGLARQPGTEAGRRLVQIVLWAYSGKRHFLDDPAFAAWAVTDNLTSAFPPTLITVGNADPLRPHSELLAEKLRAQAVEAETLFFPNDHQPPLGHEYQFDLDTDAGQLFLERVLTS